MEVMFTREGPPVSRIALGMMRLRDWRLSAEDTLKLIEKSIDIGVTTFDHADIYGGYSCEELFGKALALSPSIRRNMQIVTKCGIMIPGAGRGYSVKHYDTSFRHITESAENSLRKLRTDYIDILLIHRPDPMMNVDEIASAFSSLKESGKVLHFGVSNFTPGQYDLLASRLDFPLVTNQVECSVLQLNPFLDGTIDTCVRYGCRPMAWSPLGGGDLMTGNSDRIIRVRNCLEEISQKREAESIDLIALAWLLNHPSGIVPVVGTGKFERIKRAVKAIDFELSRDEWFRIWTCSNGSEVP